MSFSKINKTVCLFSSQSNSSFIYNEVEQLSENFEHVYLIIMNTDSYPFKLQLNVKLVILNYDHYSSIKTLKSNLFYFLNIIFLDVMHSPILLFRFKILKANLSALLRNFYISESILRLPFLSNDCVLYTFWFDEWATNLSILKKRNKIKNYMSLAHGFDIYEERTPDTKKIAFRWFQLKYVNRVYSVSKIGEDYLKNRYPQYADKIKTAYLQTNYKGRNKLSAGTNTILTCANFHLVKRLNLIPEILKHLNIEITWVLIGQMNNDDENVRKFLNEVEVVCKNNPLVQIKIMGELSNEDVFDFYLKNTVNVLLSVSQSEGLPVSMMEAISFGVPIIGTNVGGCSEIINDSTGILIDKDINPKEVSEIIMRFFSSNKNTEGFRNGVFNFWKENFSKNEFKFLSKF